MYTETMTMYYTVSTRGSGVAIRRGNRTSLSERDKRSKEKVRLKTKTWTFTKREIQGNYLIRKKGKGQNRKAT